MKIIYWFVYREIGGLGRVVGPLTRDIGPAFRLWGRISHRIRRGAVRLMYGDCILPAKTYRRFEASR